MASATMLKVLALLYFIEVSVAVKDWNDLRVRFSPLKSNGFYKIPLNTSSEDIGDYVKVEKEAQFDLDIYCFPNDPRGCIIVDKEGSLVGFQISFLKEDYTNVKPEDYDISKVTNFIQTNHFNISAHSFRIYFANPEKLKEKGRQNKTKADEGIWVYMNGELKELPRYQPSTPEYEGFYQQGCVRGMGLHYFHDINKNVTDCSGIFPLFLLYDDKDLIGVGLATAGKGSSGPQRDWYERPPSFAIGAVVLVCFLKFAQSWRKFNSLRIKYGMDITEAYYEIPTSTKSPLMIDYEMVQPEPDYKFLMDFYCYKDDPRVCFMYDKRGNIAGCQISMLVEDLKHVRPMYYNYSAIGNFFVTNFLNFPAYSQRTYFTNPEILTEQGRQNISEIAEGLWTYLEGKLVQIQRRRPEQKISQDFYSQGCILGMGSHYFYKINPNASCDDSFPLFASYDEESLVGYGMIFVGYGSHGPERGWYEHPVNEALLFITPDYPECLYDLAIMYGVTMVHVYLVDNPWNIFCDIWQ